MSSFAGRCLVSIALAPLLALSGALAPEHVHETDGDRTHAVAHRHAHTHELAAHDHDGAELDHGDGHVVWLDDVGAYKAPYQLPMPDGAVGDHFELAPAAAVWIVRSVDDTAPPHGPPRLPQSLRAPPASRL